MDAPDRPLSDSQEVLRALVEWGRSLQPRMVRVIEDRKQPHHRVAAAAHVHRLPNLCEGVRLLNAAALFDEAATLVRVIVELAINAEWVGTSDSRALDLALDLADSASHGDALRTQHLDVKSTNSPVAPAKRLVNLMERAKQAGPDSMGLYAGVEDILSGPTHSAVSMLSHLDDDAKQLFGRGVAGLAAQAATRLGTNSSKILGITEWPASIRAAYEKWESSAP